MATEPGRGLRAMSTEPASAEAAGRESANTGLPGGPAAPQPGQPLCIQYQGIDRLLRAGAAYRIGRDPQADVAVADARVSWLHAIVEEQNGSWLLQDARSKNGTYVNRQRVPRLAITASCSVRLGHPDDGPMLICSLGQARQGEPTTPAQPEAAAAVWPREDLQDGQMAGPPAQRSGRDRSPSAVMKLPTRQYRIGRASVFGLLTWRRLAKTTPGKRR
jgi:ABC transport system ATP-binding/permease protein